jgi:predicted aconitase with swiveling domain
MTHKGRTLAVGSGKGPIVRLDQPLSLWGGMDPERGIVIDPHHPQAGRLLTGSVVVMPSGRGSSSSSSILAEAIRAGTAPAAIILLEPDPILALGSIVAAELYGRTMPVVAVDPQTFDRLEAGVNASVVAEPEEAAILIGG